MISVSQLSATICYVGYVEINEAVFSGGRFGVYVRRAAARRDGESICVESFDRRPNGLPEEARVRSSGSGHDCNADRVHAIAGVGPK